VHLPRVPGILLRRPRIFAARLAAAGAAAACAAVSVAASQGALAGEAAGPGAARLTYNCTQEQVDQLVVSFIAAWNAGRAVAVDRLFAPEPAFQWLSMRGPGDRLGKKAKDRSTIRAFVRQRHRHHDRITLLHEQGNFQLLVRRWADDYHARNEIRGKGEANCPAGKAPKLTVWSL
jgi:hypothetical protein